MPENAGKDRNEGRSPAGGGFDRELNVRAIVVTGIGLAAILVVSAALMWPLAAFLRERGRAADPPPPLLPEARHREMPPEPRLQVAPERELEVLRAEEERMLTSYAWVDETGGIAQVPIERAIELVVEFGLPAPVPEEPLVEEVTASPVRGAVAAAAAEKRKADR